VTTATGVKHLHHFALQVDWAIYFESNGHGAFICKKEKRQKVKDYIQYLKKHYSNDHDFARLT